MYLHHYDIVPQPEDAGEHDYRCILPWEGRVVVNAHALLDNPQAEIIAYLIDSQREFYLYGKDDRLYHHMYNDELLNQFVPFRLYMNYLDSFTSPDNPGTATESKPDGWHHYQCYPANVYIVIHGTILEAFRKVKDNLKSRLIHPDSIDYYVGELFPLVIHEALIEAINSI
jgi:hypothetical protein